MPGGNWQREEAHLTPSSISDKVLDFLLQEYWQLRQEIRDRLNSQRTIIQGTITAFTAVLAVCGTLLGRTPLSFWALALLWLIPFFLIIPAQMLLTSEQLAIIRIARYLRLHIELVFLEATVNTPALKSSRMPLGWETYLLFLRRAKRDLSALLRWQRENQHQQVPPPTIGQDVDPWSEAAQSADPTKPPVTVISSTALLNPHNQRALHVAHGHEHQNGKSITWMFRAMAIIAAANAWVFTALAVAYQQCVFLEHVPQRAVMWIVVGVVGYLSLAGLAYAVTLTKRYQECSALSSYWDVPGMTPTEIEQMIRSFKHDRPA